LGGIELSSKSVDRKINHKVTNLEEEERGYPLEHSDDLYVDGEGMINVCDSSVSGCQVRISGAGGWIRADNLLTIVRGNVVWKDSSPAWGNRAFSMLSVKTGNFLTSDEAKQALILICPSIFFNMRGKKTLKEYLGTIGRCRINMKCLAFLIIHLQSKPRIDESELIVTRIVNRGGPLINISPCHSGGPGLVWTSNSRPPYQAAIFKRLCTFSAPTTLIPTANGDKYYVYGQDSRSAKLIAERQKIDYKYCFTHYQAWDPVPHSHFYSDSVFDRISFEGGTISCPQPVREFITMVMNKFRTGHRHLKKGMPWDMRDRMKGFVETESLFELALSCGGKEWQSFIRLLFSANIYFEVHPNFTQALQVRMSSYAGLRYRDDAIWDGMRVLCKCTIGYDDLGASIHGQLESLVAMTPEQRQSKHWLKRAKSLVFIHKYGPERRVDEFRRAHRGVFDMESMVTLLVNCRRLFFLRTGGCEKEVQAEEEKLGSILDQLSIIPESDIQMPRLKLFLLTVEKTSITGFSSSEVTKLIFQILKRISRD
jgi:hypothetical protein